MPRLAAKQQNPTSCGTAAAVENRVVKAANRLDVARNAE
jgi:hypothetical protein